MNHSTNDEELKIELNYEHVIHAIEKTLNLWKWRDLTVFGKVQIIKTFVVPKISYCTNIISFNTEKLNEIKFAIISLSLERQGQNQTFRRC